MRKLFFLISICITVSAWAKTPKIETVSVEDIYIIPESETLKLAREKAILQAQNKAIADKFGTVISSSSHLSMSNGANGDGEDFRSFSVADVNGEWIETISEETVPSYDANGLSIYTVKLKGKVREILHNPIDIEWCVLSNGTNIQKNLIVNNTLFVGDFLYLFFQSPVDGYLAVYLEDTDPLHTTQCLIPYRGTSDGVMKIEADKPYILFSKEDADPEIRSKVLRLKMGSNSDIDYNHLYIVFSPNNFSKAIDNENSADSGSIIDNNGEKIYLMPRQLEGDRFHKWLAKGRSKDSDMQVFHTILQIKR